MGKTIAVSNLKGGKERLRGKLYNAFREIREDDSSFGEHIPHSVRTAESTAKGVSIFTHNPNRKVAAAYQTVPLAG
jgi:cellulose biosynthesis protein BcsQ